jgi:hypothetical protein
MAQQSSKNMDFDSVPVAVVVISLVSAKLN